MEKTFSASDEKLSKYALDLFLPQDVVLKEILERSTIGGLPEIQVAPMDGRHLEILVRMTGAKKVVEIGTLGGYSGVCIARALPQDGKLYTFEYYEHHAKVARESFQKAGVDRLIEIAIGPALENLHRIESYGPFDLVFLDADKVSYPQYLNWAEKNLRVGGVVIGDNTFAWGMIHDVGTVSADQKPSVQALREFNARLADSKGRFRSTILPTGEGLTIGVKIR